MPQTPSRSRLRAWLVPACVLLAALVLTVGWWRWPRRPPVAGGTAIVVSPHPDDETYAMGQTIAAQVAAGRRVIGVLVTDGEAASYAATWTAEAGEDLDGDGDVDRWDFGLARRAEYRAAMEAAGADGELVFLGAAGSQGTTGFADGRVEGAEVRAALEQVLDGAGDGAGFLTLARYEGRGPLARLTGDAREHPDHTAVYEAVRELALRRGNRAWFFKVYVAYSDPWKRLAPAYVSGPAELRERKRAMADAYRIGAISTPELWDAAHEDRYEYIGRSYLP